jgi:hypothetical protein
MLSFFLLPGQLKASQLIKPSVQGHTIGTRVDRDASKRTSTILTQYNQTSQHLVQNVSKFPKKFFVHCFNYYNVSEIYENLTNSLLNLELY